MPSSRPLEERFWEKVEKTSSCWIWTASKDGCGYGLIGMGPGRKVGKANRVSWELHNGPIPKGKCVLHHCDTPQCVNPDHLFLGTQRINALDREAKGRGNHAFGDNCGSRKHPECLRRGDNHHMRREEFRPRGEKNVRAKLTNNMVLEIRKEWLEAKAEYAVIAQKYGVSPSTIGYIIRRRSWAHLPEVQPQ